MSKRQRARAPSEVSKDVGRFLDDLQKESDRGCAMVAAAYLEESLESLLRAAFISDPKAVDELFDPMRPISDFAAKTEVSYCLGLIRAVCILF
jgi:hypothetical protein